MKLVAHYKSESLQKKGWSALAKYRPRKTSEDDTPTLTIEIDQYSDAIRNEIVQQLKRTSMPFLIEKVKEPVHDDTAL